MPHEQEPLLADIGEAELVRRITRGLPVDPAQVQLGAGDDCALLPSPDPTEWLLFKTDCMVENVHFTQEMDPVAVGRKAVARTVSDFAAMAGRPESFLVTTVFPKTLAVRYVEGLYQGITQAAKSFEISVAGGETSSTPGGIMLSIAMLGRVPKELCVLRSGAQPGDRIFVTGTLGKTLETGWHLHFSPRLDEAEWLSKNFPIHAMMDLSDGVAADLPRIAEASGVGWQLNQEAVPRRGDSTIAEALNDGEDFELLFTLPAGDADRLKQEWPQKFSLALTEIGEITEAGLADQTEITQNGGYDHFR